MDQSSDLNRLGMLWKGLKQTDHGGKDKEKVAWLHVLYCRYPIYGPRAIWECFEDVRLLSRLLVHMNKSLFIIYQFYLFISDAIIIMSPVDGSSVSVQQIQLIFMLVYVFTIVYSSHVVMLIAIQLTKILIMNVSLRSWVLHHAVERSELAGGL